LYRHILVPVDDSDLSIDTASKAVELAKSLGARITFFHARRDFIATGSGALVHAMSPAEFADQAAGNARAVLAKAESEARYAGVDCELIAKTSDRPYEVIVDTAEERGCDLIFMASHGQRGVKKLFLGSQTKKVLAHTHLPVLVSTVESNARSPEMSTAISILKGEHRSMGAVLGGLKHVLADAREKEAMADTDLLRAIVYYLRKFPEAGQ